jgi:inosose dehydratase
MPPDQVLAEMREVGLDATELGPPGYLPAAAAARRRLLDRYGMRLVAGFLATVLHDPRSSAVGEIEMLARALADSGAEVLILAAALPGESYDRDEQLSKPQWTALAKSLASADEIASAHGLRLSFHPHSGTAVARKEDVNTVLEMTSVEICLDTGHLFLGGADPAEVAGDTAGRVNHVHLKDVDTKLVRRIRAGEMTYGEGVAAGLYRPLGHGDLDIEAVVGRLHGAGYRGWYVLEQDMALTAEHARGPLDAAALSLEYFRRIAGADQHVTVSKED